ncbi:MAG: ATP cone domain-containing protein [Candidatus Hodarchaeota archaeon]
MVKEVVKRSGDKEIFIREKIIVSCLKTGAPVGLAREIAAMVETSSKDVLTTQEIRESVLVELGRADESYRNSWVMYDKEKGRTGPA